jgi:uracil-DNA glycosylase
MTETRSFDEMAVELRACRLCREAPQFLPALAHEPRPIIQGSTAARLCIASQAPGTRAHRSGIPFQDASGHRLRDWLGLSEPEFYDPANIAIIPMGACFPGQDLKGGDLPPRRECAAAWRPALMNALPRLELILLVGRHAQTWHLGETGAGSLMDTMSRWREHLSADKRPRVLPLPHPSWRNNVWLRQNPWFEADLLPVLRREVRAIVTSPNAEIAA